MLMLLDVILPNEPFNAAVRAGTAGETIGKILGATKSQAVYFTQHDGHRGAVLVVDVEHSAQIPALAEPWFLHFNADCKFRIAMTVEDLRRAGLPELGKTWS